MAAGTVAGTASPDYPLGLPRTGYPYSLSELRKSQLKAPLYSFLRRMATRDVVTFFDDFNRKAIDSTNLWSVANGGGASAASFAINTQYNGVIRATTGTANDDTATASLIGPIIYPGYASPMIEVRFKAVSSVAAIKVEVGFIDAVPASNTGGVNNMDTPTAYASDLAVLAIDTAATANKWNLVTKGSATNQAIKKTNGTGTIAAVGTWQTVRVQLFSQELSTANSAHVAAWLDGQLVATHDASATAGVGAVNGSVLLAPWVYLKANSATSKSLDIDYVHVVCERIA